MQGKRRIFIDSCAVDVLFDNEVDILAEFPRESYELFLSKGVRHELLDIPDEKPVKRYAISLINNTGIEEPSFFVLSDINYPESGSRYTGGLDEGYFASNEQLEFLDKTKNKLGSSRKSGLAKNETDRDLLALSLESVTLTAESKIGGMSKIAEDNGSKIVNIKKWRPNEITLRGYVEAAIIADAS
jgi:hypothetical protein